jgi:photosystem II stability/assembly factor-like uncharacterized protein
MTIDRDLDLQLPTWFDERSTSTPPADLLARSLGRVEMTHQRPSILTTGAYARPWVGVNRAPLAAPLLVGLMTLLLGALVAVGAQLVFPRLAVVLPLQTPGPSSTAEPTRAPVPTPVDTRPAALSINASAFGTAWDPIAFGDKVAWIRTDNGLYRTEDAGLTWRAVEPAGFSQPSANAFADADTAYVKVGDESSIAFTHDGGASWTTTSLDAGNGGAPEFEFTDATHGFVTFVDPALDGAPGGTGLLVFMTTDGGATWSGPVRSRQPRLANSSNKLGTPTGANLVESAGKADNKPFDNTFYVSGDGGQTWSKDTFPINSISPKNDMKGVGQVYSEPNGRLLVQFSSAPSGPGTHPNGIYESTDDPSVWRLLYTEPEGDVDVQFLSATTWILRSHAPSRISTTLDAGATWSTVTPTMSLYYTGPPVFGSVNTGWFTIECRWVPNQPNCPRSDSPKLLFVTRDGGATWTEVGR